MADEKEGTGGLMPEDEALEYLDALDAAMGPVGPKAGQDKTRTLTEAEEPSGG